MITISCMGIIAGTVILKGALTYWNYLYHFDMGQSIGFVGQSNRTNGYMTSARRKP